MDLAVGQINALVQAHTTEQSAMNLTATVFYTAMQLFVVDMELACLLTLVLVHRDI